MTARRRQRRAPGVGATTVPAGARVASDVLKVALGLALWFTFGSFVLVLVDGLGDHPVRRLAVGSALILVSALAVLRRQAVTVALRSRPWLVLPLAGGALGVAAIDGLIDGPYVGVSTLVLALAVVVARARTVWLCVALLEVVYAGTILASHSPTALVRGGDLDGMAGVMLGYPFVALVGLGLVRCYVSFLRNADAAIVAMRHGVPALTPALTRAIERGSTAGELPLPPPPPPRARLTAAEARVVEGLADGRSPKQLAYDWGVSLATVRTHIANAKRKTGARTLPELAALAARPDWTSGGASRGG